MEPLLFVLVALAAAALAYHQHRKKSRRREALLLLATTSGLEYARHDPLGLAALPFRFLRQGDDRGVENVVYGRLGDDDVAVFDLWVMHESTDAKGNRSRRYEHFTCAYLVLPGARLPRIEIRPETVLSRLKDGIGLRDVQFESDEFNRRWDVRSDDRRSAYTVVDARMMRFLLSVEDVTFELHGGHLLAATRQLAASSVLTLHHLSTSFRDAVPALATELFPDGDARSGRS